MPEESSGRTSPGRPPTARPSAAETALAGLTAPDRRKTPRPDSLELRLDAALRERRSDSRILIVDDTATNRKLLRAILANEGCEILEATDPDACIDTRRRVEFHMASDKPGLIIRRQLMALLEAHGEREVHG